MSKRLVSLIIIATLLLSLFIPYLPRAFAQESITFLPVESNESGIHLNWETISPNPDEEIFTLLKDDQELKITPAQAGEAYIDRNGNTHKTYQVVDSEVSAGETYTYIIQKTIGSEVIQSQPIKATYELQQGEPTGEDTTRELPSRIDDTFQLNVTEETETSITVSWEAYQTDKEISYQLYSDGELIEEFQALATYKFEELQPDTNYSLQLKVIENGAILDETQKNVRTKAIQDVQRFTVFTYVPNESTIEANWFYDGASSYNVYLDGELTSKEVKLEEIIFDNLEADTYYEVKVEALDSTKLVLTTASAKAQTAKSATGTQVTISDKQLERAIKEQLHLNRDELYESDLKRLTTLNASDLGIKDLDGLELAVNLEKLEVAGNKITDLSNISVLKNLEYLDIAFFQGKNFDAVSGLTGLKTLIVAETSFTDLNLLSSLTQLETLDISYTNVTELSPLTALTNLREINISYLDVKKIMTLKELPGLQKIIMYGEFALPLMEEVETLKSDKLEIITDDFLNLWIESIHAGENSATFSWSYEGQENVSHYVVTVNSVEYSVEDENSQVKWTLSNLTPNTDYNVKVDAFNGEDQLIGTAWSIFKTLSVPEGNKVSFNDARLEKAIKSKFGLERDLVESDMKFLTELDLTSKKITDLTGLESATNLNTLILAENKVTDISVLGSLTKLNLLVLDGNAIEDFAPLKELKFLNMLSLSETGIKDLSVLESMQNLNDLWLDFNEISDLDSIAKLVQLGSLSLTGNNLESIKGIQALPALSQLSLMDNPITSIKELGVLSQLNSLDLSGTQITSIDELLTLNKLWYVSLYNVETLDLSEGSAAKAVIKELEQKGVYVDYEVYEEFYVYSNFISENSIEVQWEYVGEKEISEYEVLLNGNSVAKQAPDEPYYLFEQLEADTEYEIVIRAYDAAGELLLDTTTTERTWSEPSGEFIEFKDVALKEAIQEQLGISRELQESDMERLNDLSLFKTEVKDLSGLEYAKNLYSFSVNNNAYSLDLTPLKGISELSNLSISNSKIKDYKVIKEFKNLDSLAISDNELEDISFLSSMEYLSDLTLDHNKITDISVLSSLRYLSFVNLAYNKITDLTPLLGSKENLLYLDMSGNPLVNITAMSQFPNLFELILDETLITDLSPLLQMDSLENVSLYGIETLDLTEGSENTKTIQELRGGDVRVNLEIDSNPEIYINEVTEKSIKLSWDPMLPKDQGNYTLTLYSSDYSEILDEVTIDPTETCYEFTNLDADTTYYIEVVAESEEHFGFVSTEVTTLAIDTVFKDVSIFLQDQKGNPVSAAEFELAGADEGNEQIYLSGLSEEDGRLVDYSGEEPLDVFTLQTGNYELNGYTEDGEEFLIEFEVLESVDYLKNPLTFVINSDEPIVDEGQTPTDNGEKDPSVDIKGEDNSNNGGKTPVKNNQNSSDYNLPNTATGFYNILLIGTVLIILGISMYGIRKRKINKI